MASFDSFDQLYSGWHLAVDDVARTLITISPQASGKGGDRGVGDALCGIDSEFGG